MAGRIPAYLQGSNSRVSYNALDRNELPPRRFYYRNSRVISERENSGIYIEASKSIDHLPNAMNSFYFILNQLK